MGWAEKAALQASNAVDAAEQAAAERIAACEAQFDISNEGLTVASRLQEIEELIGVPHSDGKISDRIAAIEEAVGIS